MKAKKPKPRPVVLGKLNLRGMILGDGTCSCLYHTLNQTFPKIRLGSSGTLLWLPDPKRGKR